MLVVPSYFISFGSCGVFLLSGKFVWWNTLSSNGAGEWGLAVSFSFFLGDVKRLGERHGRRPGVFARF